MSDTPQTDTVGPLLNAYQQVLSRSRVGTPNWLGFSWFLQFFLVRHVRRALTELLAHYRRRSASGNDEWLSEEQQLAKYLDGVPDVLHTKTAFSLLVLTFVLPLPVIMGPVGSQLLTVVPAALTLDGSAIVGSVSKVDVVDAARGTYGLLFWAVIVGASPILAFRRQLDLVNEGTTIATPEAAAPTSQGAPSATDAEQAAFVKLGSTSPLDPPYDMIVSSAILFTLSTSSALLFWPHGPLGYLLLLGLLCIPIGGLATFIAISRKRAGRPLRRQQTRGAIVCIAVLVLGVPAITANRFESSKILFYELTEAKITNSAETLADFKDRTPTGSTRPVDESYHLSEYPRVSGSPAADRAIIGLEVSFNGRVRGAQSGNSNVVATLHDARTRVPVGDVTQFHWYSTIWPLGFDRAEYTKIGGNVWLPRPTQPGTYFVKIVITETVVTEDPATIPDNRVREGPLVLRNPNGVELSSPFFRSERPITAIESNEITI